DIKNDHDENVDEALKLPLALNAALKALRLHEVKQTKKPQASWAIAVTWNQLAEWWMIPEERRRDILKKDKSFPLQKYQLEKLALYWREHVVNLAGTIQEWGTVRYAVGLATNDLAAAQQQVAEVCRLADLVQIPLPANSSDTAFWEEEG